MKGHKNHIVILSILLCLLGIYLLAAGLANTWNFVEVIKSSIFWGLFHLITGIFLMMHINKISKKKK